jgi:hypothetical protein
MFKHLKRSLNNKVSKIINISEGDQKFIPLDITEGEGKLTPKEFIPALMAQNNYVDNMQPLESKGLMQYIDIDCIQQTEKGEPLSVRMMLPDIPPKVDYLIVRIKCTPQQLRSSGLNFKVWLPK